MSTATRVVFNTVVLYIKIIVTTLISLVSVPLILKALGADDYGLFNLVLGVIAMLAFLNASLAISTQRFMSVAIGYRSSEKLNVIFNTALVLHLLMGLLLVAVFEICGFFVFDYFLNINPERIPAAKTIYQYVVFAMFFGIISVPYSALMNAKENMLAFCVVAVIDSVLKLLLALSLFFYENDRLVFYGAGIAFISIFNVIVNRLYVKKRYKEISFSHKRYFDSATFKKMFGFAGWNTFGSVASLGRNQGVAVIMNLFLGTAINAAYGIANQVNGVLVNISATCTKSINPQLMQSEGMGDRARLRKISYTLSKISIIIMAFFAVPLIIEMPYIIKLWIKDVPAYTVIFCQLVLVVSMLQQYSNGLMSAIQAVGKIGRYQLTMGLLLLLNVPICYVLMRAGYPPYACIICFILIEIICLIARITFAQRLVGMAKLLFTGKVILPTLATIMISSVLPLVIRLCMPESFIRLTIVCLLYMLIFVFSLWIVALDKTEKQFAKNLFVTFKQKFKKAH